MQCGFFNRVALLLVVVDISIEAKHLNSKVDMSRTSRVVRQKMNMMNKCACISLKVASQGCEYSSVSKVLFIVCVVIHIFQYKRGLLLLSAVQF